ncbi:MAG: polysaccharide deacetylase [Alphaproteobacteria bacterium PA4]|nr:MAG: polysaccharide deacetylase [Alphaproteobacteria bacterium PA4]
MAVRSARRRLGLGALLALALFLAAFGVHRLSKARCFALTGEAICRVETRAPLVALTFDDGPTALGLDTVLPLLHRYQARGTFFMIGKLATPQLVARVVADGHEIGNHSFHHKQMMFRSAAYYDAEIADTDRVLQGGGAPLPVLFRPPFGKKLFGLPLAVARSHKRMIMWDAGDPPDRDPQAYARKVLAEVRPGSIILIHPMYAGNATERAALPLILAELARRGYRMVTVSQLLASHTEKDETGGDS